MASFFDFDEIFRSFDEIMKRMRGFETIESALKSGKLKGGWDVKQIDDPNVKGYVIQGRFRSDHPFEPFDPLQPKTPFERRPLPRRSFKPSEIGSKETREPLTDVFEENKAVTIYVELPGEEKEDIQLNVAKGMVKIKAKNFYKRIEVPRNVDVEKAASKYNNGVLTITIPHDKTSPDQDKRRITID